MSIIEDLVIASRTCVEHGVIDAYGHVSARSEVNSNHYFMSRDVAPELMVEEDIQSSNIAITTTAFHFCAPVARPS